MKLSEAYWSRRKSISYFLPIYILYFIRNNLIFCISYRKISSTEIGQLKPIGAEGREEIWYLKKIFHTSNLIEFLLQILFSYF